jgi:hypothetical protein
MRKRVRVFVVTIRLDDLRTSSGQRNGFPLPLLAGADIATAKLLSPLSRDVSPSLATVLFSLSLLATALPIATASRLFRRIRPAVIALATTPF